jgi:hypothetical protein
MKGLRLDYFVLLSVILVIPLWHVSCGPDHGPPPALPFEVSVLPEVAFYLPGEVIEIKLSLTNVSSDPITVNPYPPEIHVARAWSSDEVVFSQASGTQSQEIAPDDSVTVEFAWNQEDYEEQQALPGWYDVIFFLVMYQNGGTQSESFTARVLIQYPQGVMEKTIALNESQTVNEVTITLEWVEMSETGTKFHASAVLPYPPPELPPGFDPRYTFLAEMYAEYIVDGVTKPAGESLIHSDDWTTAWVTWGYGIYAYMYGADPIPSDAERLTFRITGIEWYGRWAGIEYRYYLEGPWEFEIPLD